MVTAYIFVIKKNILFYAQVDKVINERRSEKIDFLYIITMCCGYLFEFNDEKF